MLTDKSLFFVSRLYHKTCSFKKLNVPLSVLRMCSFKEFVIEVPVIELVVRTRGYIERTVCIGPIHDITLVSVPGTNQY